MPNINLLTNRSKKKWFTSCAAPPSFSTSTQTSPSRPRWPSRVPLTFTVAWWAISVFQPVYPPYSKYLERQNWSTGKRKLKRIVSPNNACLFGTFYLFGSFYGLEKACTYCTIIWKMKTITSREPGCGGSNIGQKLSRIIWILNVPIQNARVWN